MQSYTDLFSSRGSAYDIAMRRYPDARAAEFQQAVAAGRIEPGMLVGDVPAGGGYLSRYLPEDCICLGHEPCSEFTSRAPAHSEHGDAAGGQGQETRVMLHAGQEVSLLPLPWQEGVLDVLISLAGVHHLEDKCPLFAEMRRVTRPGGRLILSDVAEGSPTARFLDGFVGANNSTGHEGLFLNEETLEDLRRTGWRILEHETAQFHWRFANRQDMGDFCRSLFDIRSAGPEAVIAAIEEGPGTDMLPGGLVGMRWSLTTITAENPV